MSQKDQNLIIKKSDISKLSESFSEIESILKNYSGDLEIKAQKRPIQSSMKISEILDTNIEEAKLNTLLEFFSSEVKFLISELSYPMDNEHLENISNEFDSLINEVLRHLKEIKETKKDEGVGYLEKKVKELQKTSQDTPVESKSQESNGEKNNSLKDKVDGQHNEKNQSQNHSDNDENQSLYSSSQNDNKNSQNNDENKELEGLEDSSQNNDNNDNKDSEDDLLEIKNIIDQQKNKIGRIQAKKLNSQGEYNIKFNCFSQSQTFIESKKSTNSNKEPLGGVLFEIDKPSEEIPNVGPGMPLYIPREVAETVKSSIIGYPLDSDPTLKRHRKTNIVGIIENAYIEGQSFIIEGNLWINNQEEQVQKIIENKQALGLSMNADASGHVEIIDNQEVFYIDELQVWGANILYSDLATYQQAKISASNQFDEDRIISKEYAIKAEKSTSHEEKTMDGNTKNEILQSLKSLHDSFNEQQRIQAEKNKQLESDLNNLKSTVDQYEQERKEVEAKKQEEKSKQQKEEEQKQLIEAVKSEIGSLVDEKIEAIKNPRGEPKRKTKSVEANNNKGNQESDEVNEIRLELSRINGALEHAQSLPFEKQLSLQEEKTQLENKLSMITE